MHLLWSNNISMPMSLQQTPSGSTESSLVLHRARTVRKGQWSNHSFICLVSFSTVHLFRFAFLWVCRGEILTHTPPTSTKRMWLCSRLARQLAPVSFNYPPPPPPLRLHLAARGDKKRDVVTAWVTIIMSWLLQKYLARTVLLKIHLIHQYWQSVERRLRSRWWM